MAKPSESELVRYYCKYKELILLHQELGFGSAPRSSEGFTESLCCHLFGFSKAINVNRDYDLFDPATKMKIEVKATTSVVGATTINPNSQFDFLYWVIFLLPQDSILVHKIPYSEFESFINSRRQEARSQITLRKFKPSETKIFAVSEVDQRFVPQTVAEQCAHIKKKVG